MEDNPITLQAGMVVTNEPGLYKAGSHGIRTENILLVVPSGEGMFGNYLQFETVTLCPIDKRPIIKDLLSDEEIDWLNKYHQRVYDLLSPQLDYDERYWLANATTPL
jgi:Xaa-Pro aminopeptidase